MTSNFHFIHKYLHLWKLLDCYTTTFEYTYSLVASRMSVRMCVCFNLLKGLENIFWKRSGYSNKRTACVKHIISNLLSQIQKRQSILMSWKQKFVNQKPIVLSKERPLLFIMSPKELHISKMSVITLHNTQKGGFIQYFTYRHFGYNLTYLLYQITIGNDVGYTLECFAEIYVTHLTDQWTSLPTWICV